MTNNGHSWRVGDAHITQIYETDAGSVIQSGLPDATPQRVLEIPWLQPEFADGEGALKGVVQAFIVEVDGAVTVVDTCVGNGKTRPEIAEWSDLQTDFLQRMTAAGFAPSSVDNVVCTHLHFDHVGWNTKMMSGNWVPTFAHARHFFQSSEFEYWKGAPEREIEDDRAGFRDSVLPIVEAGLASFIDVGHRISESISLLPTPGHTPGHVSIQIESRGERAIITGDAFHHPCQISHPEWASVSDYDAARGVQSRRELLEDLVGTDTLLLGSHFAPPFGGVVRADGGSFKLERRN